MWLVSVLMVRAVAVDLDGDAVPDDLDVCPGVADAGQVETSAPADGAGDACAAPRAYVDPTATMFGEYVDPKARIEAGASVGVSSRVGRRSVVGAGAVVGASVFVAADVSVGAGATIGDGVTVGFGAHLDPGVDVGADVVVGSLATLRADVGSDSTVGRAATIEGVVGAGVDVGPDVVIEAGATAGAGSKLRRGVRIRAGATVADDARVGRGVDVGEDADIGARAVVRAGAIVPDGGVVAADTTLGRGEIAPIGAGACDASEAYVWLMGGFSPNSSYAHGQVRRVTLATGAEAIVQPAVPFVEEMLAYAGGPLYVGFGRRQPNAPVDPALGLSLARLTDPAGAIDRLTSFASEAWEYYPSVFTWVDGDLVYGVNSYTTGPAVDRFAHRYDLDLDVDTRIVTRPCCSMETVTTDWERGFLTLEGETLLRYDGTSVTPVADAADWDVGAPGSIAAAPDGTLYGSHIDFDFESFPFFSMTASIRRYALDGSPSDVVVTALDGRDDYEVIDLDVDCEGDLWILAGFQQNVGPRVDQLFEVPGGTGVPELRYTTTSIGDFSASGFTISR
jgi:carbonic anhydrase/acetyltransferase-like protein (isoleucine patch superfamily)